MDVIRQEELGGTNGSGVRRDEPVGGVQRDEEQSHTNLVLDNAQEFDSAKNVETVEKFEKEVLLVCINYFLSS